MKLVPPLSESQRIDLAKPRIHTFRTTECPWFEPLFLPVHNLKFADPSVRRGLDFRLPEHIWIEGTDEALKLLDRLPEHGLGIVGTRSPQIRSLEWTESLVASLTGTPLIVISGLARGIDTAAHEGALDYGLPTIAIMGCGIHETYPSENISLRKRIVEAGGLVMSEFDPASPPYSSNFLRRNRWIASFSKATLVVEAPYRSGSLNTAHWSRALSRDTYAVPAFPDDVAFGGNRRLIEDQFAGPAFSAASLAASWMSLCSTIKKEVRVGGRSRTAVEIRFDHLKGFLAPPVWQLLGHIEAHLKTHGRCQLEALQNAAASGNSDILTHLHTLHAMRLIEIQNGEVYPVNRDVGVPSKPV